MAGDPGRCARLHAHINKGTQTAQHACCTLLCLCFAVAELHHSFRSHRPLASYSIAQRHLPKSWHQPHLNGSESRAIKTKSPNVADFSKLRLPADLGAFSFQVLACARALGSLGSHAWLEGPGLAWAWGARVRRGPAARRRGAPARRPRASASAECGTRLSSRSLASQPLYHNTRGSYTPEAWTNRGTCRARHKKSVAFCLADSSRLPIPQPLLGLPHFLDCLALATCTLQILQSGGRPPSYTTLSPPGTRARAAPSRHWEPKEASQLHFVTVP